MSSVLSAGGRLALCGLGSVAMLWLEAAPVFTPLEGEYSISRAMPGDQVKPQVSLDGKGGYVVWQDNATDGDGLGISARAINNYLSPVTARTFRVNEQGAGDQENPAVALLKDGGVIFAWQGGAPGRQDIYARVMGADGIFLTGDILVNTYTQGQQVEAAMARLNDGNIMVVWSSYGQDGSMQGVYAQRLSPTGTRLGEEFQVNDYAAYNQRSPAVAALDTGGFAVAWVSEHKRFENSVDVYFRRFAAAGSPLGGEVLANMTTNNCANPSVCPSGDGGFLVAWSQRDMEVYTNSWDIVARPFAADGTASAPEVLVNTYRHAPQYAPKMARVGADVLAVWTSDWQDGSREGVYGRFLAANGTPTGGEFRVNTSTISRQFSPALAGDGVDRFMVVWSSFIGGTASFDLLGQRYASNESVTQPNPPNVSALDSFSLMVTWPELAGYTNLVGYRLHMDASSKPIVTTGNFYVAGDLDPGSTHSFRLAYELAGGRVSPLSDAVDGTTWGRDRNFDGLPDDWQTRYWGADYRKWPSPGADSDQDGASNLNEFLAGTDPVNAASVLRMHVAPTQAGILISWDTKPGSIYQLQSAATLNGSWTDAGGPRYASSVVTSMTVPLSTAANYYRIVRIR